MVEAGDAAGLAQRVSNAGAKLAGSKPFWQSAQKDLIVQIWTPDTGTPHVFLPAALQIFNGLTCINICLTMIQEFQRMLHHIIQG